MINMNPGTVSKILWHFTGGPLWDSKLNKQESIPKPMTQGFDILIKILESSSLKLSNYSELIKVLIPELIVWNKQTRKREKKFNIEKTIKSSPVCCLADIPIQHLEFHSTRYGKFAIGFHRESAIRNSFNPVFYSLHNSPIMNSIYSGFSVIQSTDTYYIKSELDSIDTLLEDAQNELDELEADTDHIDLDGWYVKSNIESQIDDVESAIDETRESLKNFVSFVKTFNNDEFGSIYCEREWRSIHKYDFDFSDIAMIVLPKEGGFYHELINLKILPDNIPIVPWEDLIEH
ncbi:hypothetical protein T190820D02B_40129 [Tenacibaculum sp. 190524A05c]